MSNNENFEISTTTENANFAVCEVGTAPLVRESTTQDEKTLFNAVSGGSKKVKEFLGKTVDVVSIVVTSANVRDDMNDEESEKHSRPCVHFFCADGTHISSISKGICRTAESLLMFGLIPTKESPVKIKFITVDTKNGTAHSFELAD